MRNKTFVAEFVARSAAITFAMVGLLLIGCSLGEELGGENTEKLPELRRIAADTPVFPGFTEVSSSHTGKREIAVLSYAYRSSAKYEEVKSFYTNALVSKGWSSPKEAPMMKWFIDDGSRTLTFTKGEYRIEVNYDAASGSQWQFGLSYVWETK